MLGGWTPIAQIPKIPRLDKVLVISIALGWLDGRPQPIVATFSQILRVNEEVVSNNHSKDLPFVIRFHSVGYHNSGECHCTHQ